MNIFVLDTDPKIAAAQHCNKHVVRMSLEYAQLLSTAHHLRTPTHEAYLKHIYKPTHIHHPSTRWVMEHPAHYAWLYNLADAVWNEYTHRYGKVHASSRLRPYLAKVPRDLIAFGAPTPPPQCMPDIYRVNAAAPTWADVVLAYQQYYCGAKASFAKWTLRDAPKWFRGAELVTG